MRSYTGKFVGDFNPSQLAQAQASAQDMVAANMAARAAITRSAVKMSQQIFGQANITPSSTPTINVKPNNVGLITGFWVEISGTITNSTGSTLILTEWGPANMVSQFTFVDLNNNTRIQIPGWYAHALQSARARRPWGSATAPDSFPLNYGRNFTNIWQASSTIAASANTTIYALFYLPIAYSDFDLRGAIYANVVNATMSLQIQLNSTGFVVAPAADASRAVYTDNAAATFTAVSINVYQDYYDQLPVINGSPILPLMDLATIYDLKSTTLTNMAVGTDFGISYSNFRDFLSTTVMYDNGGTLGIGADINYWALQSANYTNIFKYTPKYAAIRARQLIGCDWPKGTYYFDHRDKPISTTQYGNMQLVLNASTVNSGAQAVVGYEAFALVNQLVGAASLPNA